MNKWTHSDSDCMNKTCTRLLQNKNLSINVGGVEKCPPTHTPLWEIIGSWELSEDGKSLFFGIKALNGYLSSLSKYGHTISIKKTLDGNRGH